MRRKYFFSWDYFSKFTIAFIFIAPLAVNIGDFGGKPLDLALSDIWLLFAISFWIIVFTVARRAIALPSKDFMCIVLILFSYFFVSGILGGIFNGGSISNVISMLRFAKQFLFLVAGWYIYMAYGAALLPIVFHVVCALFLFVAFSDLYFGNIPAGCGFESRWGGCFFIWDVYGFPNSTASYYVLLLGVLISGAAANPNRLEIVLIVLPLAVLIIIFTLSRAAWIYLAWVAVSAWIILLRPSHKLLYLSVFSILSIFIVIFISSNEDIKLLMGIFSKLDKSFESDPSSGRYDIYAQALHLISEKPVFGYQFDYFSKYVKDFDTPHNQYLEIAFKAGLIGFICYIFLFIIMWRRLGYLANHLPGRQLTYLRWGVFLGLMVNGIFQPIFSYSIISNLFMAAFGYLSAAAYVNKNNNYLRVHL